MASISQDGSDVTSTDGGIARIADIARMLADMPTDTPIAPEDTSIPRATITLSERCTTLRTDIRNAAVTTMRRLLRGVRHSMESMTEVAPIDATRVRAVEGFAKSYPHETELVEMIRIWTRGVSASTTDTHTHREALTRALAHIDGLLSSQTVTVDASAIIAG